MTLAFQLRAFPVMDAATPPDRPRVRVAAQIPATCRRRRVSVRTTPETSGISMNALL